MTFDQGEFNFEADGSDAGWRKWREELDEKKRAFEARWGVILGKSVVVCLRDHAKPLRGTLHWIEPKQLLNTAPPRFLLRGVEFGISEIESIIQVDLES